MSGWERVKDECEKKLDPKHIKERKGGGGVKLKYVEGWHAIDEANRIFGYGAWSRHTTLIPLGEPYAQNNKWHFHIAATVRITVDLGDHGPVVFRDGCGFGTGINSNRGDAYEIAVKTAETDATKRALVTFGKPFGLELYDKDYSVSSVEEGEGQGVGTPPPSEPPQWDEIPPQLDNRVTPQTYRNGGTDPSSANSGRSLAILKEAMEKQATPTALTRWCKEHKDAIGALTADQRWTFFSDIVYRGIDMCNTTSTELDVFWTSNEKGLNSLKKGAPDYYRDLQNYMAEKHARLVMAATGGDPDEVQLAILDAG